MELDFSQGFHPFFLSFLHTNVLFENQIHKLND